MKFLAQDTLTARFVRIRFVEKSSAVISEVEVSGIVFD